MAQMAVGKFGSGQIEDRYSCSGAKFAAVGDSIVAGVAERFSQHLCRGVLSDIINAGDWLREGSVDASPYEFFSPAGVGFFAFLEEDYSPPC